MEPAAEAEIARTTETEADEEAQAENRPADGWLKPAEEKAADE